MAAFPASKYPISKQNTIPARSGVAVPLKNGQTIKVINTHGSQVVDTWAVSVHDETYMSMCHSRASTLHLSPLPGDVLVTNHREPILKLVEDTTPTGIHDTLIAACDIHRYHELGVPKDKYHENCADNFRNGLRNDISSSSSSSSSKIDFTSFKPSPPDPLNLFMNIPVKFREAKSDGTSWSTSAGGALSFDEPVCRPGNYVVLQALRDCIVVMSACPQDILKINNQNPTDAHFIVEDGKAA